MPPKPSTPGQSNEGILRLWRLVIGLAVLAVFARAAAGEFVTWDDSFNLYENPHLNPPTLGGIGYYWFTFAYGLYIPLTYSVWGVLALMGGHDGQALNPWVFHGANVLLHAGSALATFEVLRRLVSREAAGLGALLFAVHPLQVESVAWAAGMKDVLAGLLALIALWQYLEFARAGVAEAPGRAQEAAEAAPRTRGWRDARMHYGLATIAFVLAMLAKPSAMVVPAIALAMDYWLLERPARRILGALVPWFVLSLICALVARAAQDTTGVDPAPIWARPFVAGDALAFYLYKLIWPFKLSFDYGRPPRVMMEIWWFYLSWMAPAVVGLALWITRRRWPELLVGGVIFLLAVSPVLGLATFQFQHVSTVADHYVYLAMLGVGLAAAALFDQASKRMGRSTLVIIYCVVLAGLVARSVVQTGVWKDNFALFSHAIEVNPASSVAHNGLGDAYNRDNNLVEAQPLFRRTIELDPDNWMARANLAGIHEAHGEPDEAIEQYSAALAIMRRQERGVEGAIPEVAFNLARQLAVAGRYDEALAHLELALEYRPNEPAILAAVEQVRGLRATTSPASKNVE